MKWNPSLSVFTEKNKLNLHTFLYLYALNLHINKLYLRGETKEWIEIIIKRKKKYVVECNLHGYFTWIVNIYEIWYLYSVGFLSKHGNWKDLPNLSVRIDSKKNQVIFRYFCISTLADDFIQINLIALSRWSFTHVVEVTAVEAWRRCQDLNSQLKLVTTEPPMPSFSKLLKTADVGCYKNRVCHLIVVLISKSPQGRKWMPRQRSANTNTLLSYILKHIYQQLCIFHTNSSTQ